MACKGGFDSLHVRVWLHPLPHPVSRYWFVIDLVVECKIFSGLPELIFAQVTGQFVKRGHHKLTRVYELDVVDYSAPCC